MLEDKMKEIPETEKIDFDLDKIMEVNPFEVVLAQTVDKKLWAFYKGEPDTFVCPPEKIEHRKQQRKLSLYTTWLNNQIRLMFRNDYDENGCGSFNVKGNVTGIRSLFKAEDTNTFVDYRIGHDDDGNLVKYFFVEIDKNGNYPILVEKIKDIKKRAEQNNTYTD